MLLIIYSLFALFLSAQARNVTFDEHNMPIQYVLTNYGQGDHERVTFLKAKIYPRHVNDKDRIDFPPSGYLNDYFQEAKAEGDERGHLVASQFSGPAEWYNLSPQNPRVNRGAGYACLHISWYESECKVRKFLNKGGNRHVIWTVDMTYVRDSNRPDEYHLVVDFFNSGTRVDAVDTRLKNPLLREDRSFWICRQCRSDSHGPNADCTRKY